MLTDFQIQHCELPKKGKTKKLFDGHGLHIHIFPNGSKRWLYQYYAYGRCKCLSLGVYPFVSLKEARLLHMEARKLLAQGIDPCAEKQRLKQKKKNELFGNNFADVANEWREMNRHKWTNKKALYKVNHHLDDFVMPYLGNLPITAITPMQVFRVLEKLKDRAETCLKTKQMIKAIFNHAVMTGRCTFNPTFAIPQIVKQQVKNLPSLPPDKLPEFFQKLEQYNSPSIKLALKFLILTFVRPGELRLAEWSEIKGNEWHIPAHRMKMKRDHIVPLSDWALELLEELRIYSKCDLILRGWIKQPVNNNAFSMALRKMGYKGIATPHGFRAMASTILNESGLFNPDAIERQLAHKEPNEVRAAYNRADYLEERHKMMQWYSDYIKTQYQKWVSFQTSELDF